ncbi:hypothetical protein DRQ07_10960 [candidate division KSB1 bacterium]|nr:MAG: hypothetical protein DRQ07_10960 [candidate division KSB1 bacterium]
MNRFLKELFKGFKWVLISILILSLIIVVFIGSAWGLGWLVDKLFDLKNFGPNFYISFGSVTLVFTFIIQLVTIIIIIWALLAYGKSRGLIQRRKEK